jgi:hypothetical protein
MGEAEEGGEKVTRLLGRQSGRSMIPGPDASPFESLPDRAIPSVPDDAESSSRALIR